ncbi:Nep2 [Cordylochernes scorpioides]|uniref:Nep2 n=1 Tax=Cordylochernes scorpioides TaxID=51811 RepID=A0ABY6KEA4_9ARAC|nr:Nep2 [Cordylochernes scorpioides]
MPLLLLSKNSKNSREKKAKFDSSLLKISIILVGISLFLLVVLVLLGSFALEIALCRDDGSFGTCATPVCHRAAEYLRASLNTSVDPCENFYLFACGGWIASHSIPDDKGRYVTFDVLREAVSRNLSAIFDSYGKLGEGCKLGYAEKVVALYRGCMDIDKRESIGYQPLIEVLNSFGGWPILNQSWSPENYCWEETIAKIIRNLGFTFLLSFMVGPDAKNTKRNIIYLDQGTFGVGKNELHNKTSNRSVEVIYAYEKYILRAAMLLGASGDSALSKAVKDLINFEAHLASFTLSQERKKIGINWYHKMDLEALQSNISDIDWVNFFNVIFKDIADIPSNEFVIIKNVKYLSKMARYIKNANKDVVANYIGWRIAQTLGPLTTQDFQDAQLEFDQILSGVKSRAPEWQTCTDITGVLMEFAVGRLYVEQHFPLDGKSDLEHNVEHLKNAFKVLVEVNDWMDYKTKSYAFIKLDKMENKIAFPNWILNDTELEEYYHNITEVSVDKFFESVLQVNSLEAYRDLSELRRPVNRTNEWRTGPAVVNAFYSPSSNSITFPAGILHPPFYEYGRPPALNFGAIGAVMGHEITHGYDDQGSQYDGMGNLVNWWSRGTSQNFTELASCFVTQYSNYSDPRSIKKINGLNTLGENIADNGGLRQAYKAYEVYIAKYGNKSNNKKLPGLDFTPRQLFFLAYASVWCGNERKEYLDSQLEYDSHSPSMFRVKGTLSNMKEFSETFRCGPYSPLNPTKKCVLW